MPAVLFLFTQMPFGVVPSVAAGLGLMMTHPLYARPWALRHAPRRCLWCGGSLAAGGPSSARHAIVVTDPRGTVSWRACPGAHRAALVSTFRFATRHGAWLRVGILGTVTASLAAAVLVDREWLRGYRVSDAVAFFRLGVALTVLPLGWLNPRRPAGASAKAAATPSEPPAAGRARIEEACPEPDGAAFPEYASAPFPLHLAALIGVDAVLWLFRLVGLVWLSQGAAHLVECVSRR